MTLVVAMFAVVVVRVETKGGGGAPTAPLAPLPVSSAAWSASHQPTAGGDSSSDPSAHPSSAASTRAAARTASPAGSPGRRELDTGLTRNGVYGLDLQRAAVSCDLEVRRPEPALPNASLQAYLRRVLRCLSRTFDQPLARRGFPVRTPRVVTYHRKVTTPCGTFDQATAPAYYCSASSTIYWPDTLDDGREAYTFARLGYVGLLAHEYGHHLQASTGLLDDYARAAGRASPSRRLVLSRRLELQADCFEGVFLHGARATIGLSARDRRELRVWHGYTGDEDPPKGRRADHGTSRAQIRWLERGLDSGDLGRCNTWKAPARDVT